MLCCFAQSVVYCLLGVCGLTYKDGQEHVIAMRKSMNYVMYLPSPVLKQKLRVAVVHRLMSRVPCCREFSVLAFSSWLS